MSESDVVCLSYRNFRVGDQITVFGELARARGYDPPCYGCVSERKTSRVSANQHTLFFKHLLDFTPDVDQHSDGSCADFLIKGERALLI
jgi:hypothetical protein